MKKILFSVFLSLICFVPSSAQQFTEGSLTYEPVTIDGIEGWKIVEPAEVLTGELVIPREVTHEGITKPVLEIGDEAFIVDESDDTPYIKTRTIRSRGITSLAFQNGSQVRKIDDSAFYYSLISGTVTIPATVTEISTYAFVTERCLDEIRFEYGSKIKTLYLSHSNASTLYVPESVTTIDADKNGFLRFWNIANLYVAWTGSSVLSPNYNDKVSDDEHTESDWYHIKTHTIHVPAGTKSKYGKWAYPYNFEVKEIDLANFKLIQQQFVDDIWKRALLDNPIGEYFSAIIQRAKSDINAANSESEILSILQAFKSMNFLQEYKADRVYAITHTILKNLANNDYLNSLAQPVIESINNSTSADEAYEHYLGIAPTLMDIMTLYTQAQQLPVDGTGMRMKVTKRDGTTREFLIPDKNALAFDFTGADNPVETQHYLDGTCLTFSEDGMGINLIANGAEVTYNLDNVGELSLFNGTPSVTLHANEDPDHTGKYYTTFYSGLEAYTLPEGVKAYTAEVAGESVNLSPIDGNVLPQGEAVLLYSDELQDGNWTMEVADPSAASASTANQFCGVDAQTAQADYGTYNYYMLSYGQNNLAFYKMNSSMMLSANKAFIAQSPSTPAQAMCMVFDDGNITSIASPHGDTGEGAAIYNLSGIRLNKLQKGINIVNGKKIIVK